MKFEYALQVYLKKITMDDVPILYRAEVQEILVNPLGSLLEWIRNKKWNEIKSERDRLEQAGLPFNGSVLDYDMLSVMRLTQAKDGLEEAISKGLVSEETASVEWTMQDNSTMMLTYADLKMIPLAASEYSNKLHQKARQYRSEIEGSADIAAINAIVWSD